VGSDEVGLYNASRYSGGLMFAGDVLRGATQALAVRRITFGIKRPRASIAPWHCGMDSQQTFTLTCSRVHSAAAPVDLAIALARSRLIRSDHRGALIAVGVSSEGASKGCRAANDDRLQQESTDDHPTPFAYGFEWRMLVASRREHRRWEPKR